MRTLVPLVALALGCSQTQDVGWTDAGVDSVEVDSRVLETGNLDSSDSSTEVGAQGDSSAEAAACEAGLTACGSQCVDFAGDPAHCGGCGRACAGCTSGMCPADTLVTTDNGIDQEPTYLLVDANYLYWTSASCVTRGTLDGATTFAQCPPSLTPNGHFTMDAKNLYWASAASAASAAPTGGVVAMVDKVYLQPGFDLQSPMLSPFGVAVDVSDQSLFFTALGATGEVVFRLQGEQTIQVLGSAPVQFAGIAINATDVYVTSPNAGTLLTFSRSGGPGAMPATTVAMGFVHPTDVVLDAQNAYVLDAGQEFGPSDGSITRVALSDGSKVTLASGLATPFGLVLDADDVYFTTEGTEALSYDDGSVMRVPKAGGSPTTLSANEADPRGIAIDATSVYWADFGTANQPGAIRRTAR